MTAASPTLARQPRHTVAGCSTGSGEERIDQAIRAAHKAILGCGVPISPRRVNKIVRLFCMNARRHGLTFHEYLTAEASLSPAQRRHILADPHLARVIAYLDPTGETATNRVWREQKRNNGP
ncbi:MAG: hypothetical protein ACRDTV_13390 [Mycobacterium sp.]